MYKPVPQDLNFPKMENEILRFWQESRSFEKLVEKLAQSRKRWAFLDGPITANNPMGVHHAWGRSYKDIFQRYRAMKGFNQRFQNGFDCQGLWVEVEVEKELGFTSKRDIDRFGVDAFVEKCKQRVHQYSKVQTASSIRLGMWMDWGDWDTELSDPDWMRKAHSYFTMAEENNYTIWHFLKRCHERGWIYKGHDVMPWCSRCGTAISDMEIATEGYQDLTHPGVTIKLPILGRDKEYLLVWTTTAWTLTSNVAVAVHPEMTYVRAQQKGDVFYLAKSLAGGLLEKPEILAELPGREMVGWRYRGPFDELPAQAGIDHRVVAWAEVSEAEGTGMVHIAPGCGKEDFLLGKEEGLAVVAPLDEFGIYGAGFDWLTGQDVQKVAEAIIENLGEKDLLFRLEDYRHRYPVCWRCDSELVFRLVDEWFISMKDLRHEIMEAVEQVETWIPAFGKDRELDWLRNMADWCISKKRYWGLALPIYECACGGFDVLGGREELKSRAVEGWEAFQGHMPHRPHIDAVKIACPRCGARVSRIPDVGNPWLDAGIVPYSTVRPASERNDPAKGYPFDKTYWSQWFPADFITESFPGQFRNWFYAILAMSTVLEGKAPFKKLLGFATLKDEKGEEMHKSKGNAIWSDEAAEKMGAEVMRWMFAGHNPELNLDFGYSTGEEVKRKLLTFWNVYSFFVTYAGIDGFVPDEGSSPKGERPLLDRWILSRLHGLIREADQLYEAYSLAPLVRGVEVFLEDFSTWYVRRSRRRFWKSEDDQDKRAAYETLYEGLVSLVKLIAPILPFLAEEMYQNLVRSVNPSAPESVHHSDFPTWDEAALDPSLEERMDFVRRVVALARSIRNDRQLKVRQPLPILAVVAVSESEKQALADLGDLIREELNVKALEVRPNLDGFWTFALKPRYDRLGPKFGKEAKAVAEELEGVKAEVVVKLANGELAFVETRTGKVHRDDVEILKKEKPGWAVREQDGLALALALTRSEALEDEGLAREFVHLVQAMRREARFRVTDRIHIFYRTTERLMQALARQTEYVKRETLALTLSEGDGGGDIAKEQTVNGEKATIILSREGGG